MNTNYRNNINFNGTFLINYKKAIPGIQEGFERAIGNHKRIIFRNYNGDNDTVLYVLKNSKDYDAAKFLERNNYKSFQYMPSIDTKLCFDTEQEATDYINKNNPPIIKTIKTLIEFVEANRIKCKANYKPQISQEVLKQLAISREEVTKTKDSRGIVTYTDKNGIKRVQISPRNHKGMYFIKTKEGTYPFEVARYMVDSNGEFLYKFEPDEIKLFNQKVKEAIQFLCQPEKFQ